MRRIGAMLSVALAGVGCGGTTPIMLGAILSQTGTPSGPGLDHLLAVQLAVDDVNAGGGVLGRPLALVNRDDMSDPARAAAAATALIGSDHVPAIIGAITSSSTIAVAPVVTQQKVVLISGSSTSPALTGLSPWVFRTCPSDTLQGALLAERARMHGLVRVAVIFTPGAYGQALADAFTAGYGSGGGTVVASVMLTPGRSSYADVLAEVYAASPDAILLVAYIIEGAQVIRDYNFAYSFHNTFWLFPDSLEYSSFVEGVGATMFSFRHEGTGPATPSGDAYTRFASAFEARNGRQPEGRSPQYYDAAYLVALAMQSGGRADGPSIREHLRGVADPPGTVVGPADWATARVLIAAGMKIDYDGASGAVDLDENGDVKAPYDIWDVDGGQIHIVERGVTP